MIKKIANVLVAIAAINVGLGLASVDLLGYLGDGAILMIVQALVGISGLYALYAIFKK